MVLNMIIGSALQMFCNLRPTVAIYFMVFEDLVVLLYGPFHLLNVGVEMIVPPKEADYMSFSFVGDFSSLAR